VPTSCTMHLTLGKLVVRDEATAVRERQAKTLCPGRILKQKGSRSAKLWYWSQYLQMSLSPNLCQSQTLGLVTVSVTFPIVCPRLEAKFVRKSIVSRSSRRVQNHEIAGPWRQSLSKSTDWTLTMSKSITTRENDGPPSLPAKRVATDRISHEALTASIQDRSPHSPRDYIVNSRDTAMSFIWYAI
jgi:hypothetical protein